MLPMLAEALNGHALVPEGREQIPAGVGGPRCASTSAPRFPPPPPPNLAAAAATAAAD
jgi:hypothetical protein